MRKLIAAFNMTLDGNADYTAGLPDAEIHQHYADLLRQAGVILYGRKTFELMTYLKVLSRLARKESSNCALAQEVDKASNRERIKNFEGFIRGIKD